MQWRGVNLAESTTRRPALPLHHTLMRLPADPHHLGTQEICTGHFGRGKRRSPEQEKEKRKETEGEGHGCTAAMAARIRCHFEYT